MERKTVKSYIIDLINEYGMITDAHEDIVLLEDGSLDSLDIIEISMDIDVRYNISIPDSVIEEWKTARDIIDYVIGKEK